MYGSPYLDKYQHTFDFINNIHTSWPILSLLNKYKTPFIFLSNGNMAHSPYGVLKGEHTNQLMDNKF